LSATIWISQNWSADQALSKFLSESYFGRCYIGFENASFGYFGKPSNQLSDKSVVILIALTRGSSHYDPWVYRERTESLVKMLIEQLKDKEGIDVENNGDELFSELVSFPKTACKN
jgi:membrane peptidoglycan carboxypeptidase